MIYQNSYTNTYNQLFYETVEELSNNNDIFTTDGSKI